MGTKIDRATLVRGAGTVTLNTTQLFSKGGINADVQTEWAETPVDGAGDIGKTKADEFVAVRWTPSGELTADILTALYPAAFRTPVIGTSVYGATDVAAHVHSKIGQKLTLHNARVTQMPNLKLGAKDTVFEECLVTALIANNTARSAAAAVYTLAGASWTGTITRANFKKLSYTGTWNSLTINAKEGWTVEFDTGLNPEQTDDLGTYDMTVGQIRVRARCRPTGQSEALLDQFRMQALATAAIGSFGPQSQDLTITSDVAGGIQIVLKDAFPVSGKLTWGDNELRAGEIALEASVDVATGAIFTIGIAA